ncbi:hypothetical protein BKQ64_RS26505, partial [Escherichia coli]|nr:hypothetical protein [Escherichia coli]
MKVTKSIIAVLVGLFAASAYADCEYYLTGNKETLNISDCVDGVKDIANNALSNSQNAQNVANGAASTAQNAQTTANAANSAAQNAQNTANTAQNTANSANSIAQNAQSTANQAIKDAAEKSEAAEKNANNYTDNKITDVKNELNTNIDSAKNDAISSSNSY